MNEVEVIKPKIDKKPAPKSYLDPPVQMRIKEQTKKTWERVSANRGLTQADLAKALRVQPSGVSKLFNDSNGHPWTPGHLKSMATFLKVQPDEFLAEEDRNELRGLFEGFASQGADEGFMEECTEAIRKYFLSQGITPALTRLHTLAGKLSAKLEGKSPNIDTMKAEIQILIMREAAGL